MSTTLNKDASLINLTSVPSEWEATVIVSRLQAEGITASATGGFTAGYRAEAPGLVSVLVDSRDREHAVQVLQIVEQERLERAQSLPEPGEPSKQVSPVNRVQMQTLLIVVAILACLWIVGLHRSVWVVGLALLIIGPAIWLKHRFG